MMRTVILAALLCLSVPVFTQHINLEKPAVVAFGSGKKKALSEWSQGRPMVVVTIGTECPICQKAAGVFQELADAYPQVAFLGVFTKWEDTTLIRPFLEEYLLRFPMAIDPKHRLIRQLKTDVTPEIFLIDPKGDVQYRGSVNDWFVGLGKYRTVVTEHYLKNALDAYLAGKPIAMPRTKAIGCVFKV
ncbi:MAG: redoxin domain-containing protein [Haliscomenobacter sp.]|nr:redoxin domain-containing protein [Haliscomenobacter sp.]MBK8880262.1 redoxin domain-containing protein [Haliscomenobacter sp.]